jgi:hypothetical protein
MPFVVGYVTPKLIGHVGLLQPPGGRGGGCCGKNDVPSMVLIHGSIGNRSVPPNVPIGMPAPQQ